MSMIPEADEMLGTWGKSVFQTCSRVSAGRFSLKRGTHRQVRSGSLRRRRRRDNNEPYAGEALDQLFVTDCHCLLR